MHGQMGKICIKNVEITGKGGFRFFIYFILKDECEKNEL